MRKKKNEIRTTQSEVYAMNKYFIIRGRHPVREDRGAVLILALLTLAMITVLGVYSSTRSSLELQIANNMENQVMAFFTAEAGISHGRRLMQNEFVKANQARMVTGAATLPSWDFLLNGTYNGQQAGTYWCGDYPLTTPNGCQYGASPYDGLWTLHGVQVLKRSQVVGVKTVEYTVIAWDNVDHMYNASLQTDAGSYSGTDTSISLATNPDPNCQSNIKTKTECLNDYDPLIDRDGMIFVRSYGRIYVAGQLISEAIHELTFLGRISGKGQIIPGLAQEFANEGHSSAGTDMSEINPANLGSQTNI